ncbi:MAG TPA: hypothetical protein VGJ32_06020 [Solirubrobacteraceae bacterium]
MARRLLPALGALAALLGAASPAAAATCDRTWNGSVSSSWSVAENWTPAGVPASTENVCVPAVAATDEVLVDGGGQAASITGDEPVHVNRGTLRVATGRLGSLLVDGGVLQVDGQELLVDGTLDIRGGSFDGAGTLAVAPGASMTVTGAPGFASLTVDVRGDGAWTSALPGNPNMRAGARLLVTGTMDFAADDGTTMIDSSCCWDTQPRIVVAPGGVATRSVPGQMDFFVPFEVDGDLAPAAGELRLRAGLAGGSSGSVGGAGMVDIAGGSSGTLEAGATIAGRVELTGGTTRLALGATITGTPEGRLDVAGGNLTGDGGLDLLGTLVLSGGELSGTGATTVGNLEITGSPALHDRAVLTTGGGKWTSSGTASVPIMTGTAAINIGGTFDIQATDGSYLEDYRFGYWTNSPVVRALPGGTITRTVPGEAGSDIPFEVDGAIAPSVGELRLAAGLRDTSTGRFGGTGLVTIAGGSSGVIGDGAQVTGNLKVAGGTTTLAGTVTGTADGVLEVAGGTLTGAGDVDLAGGLTLSGGDFTGSGTARAVNLDLHDAPFIFDRTVEVTGTGAWTGENSVPTI